MNGNVTATKSRRRRVGFTMIELLVVMAILVLASTGGIIVYTRSMQSAPVRTAAERMKALMVLARTQAIADDQPTQLVMDLDTGVVWIDVLTDAGEIDRPKIVTPEQFGPSIVLEQASVAGTAADTGTVTARFDRTGVNPLISVHLRRDFDDAAIDANYYTVQMWPSSGMPRITARERR